MIYSAGEVNRMEKFLELLRRYKAGEVTEEKILGAVKNFSLKCSWTPRFFRRRS